MNLTKTRNTTKHLAIKELSDENKTYSISALCEFAGIARSAYYKWLGHVNSDNDNLVVLNLHLIQLMLPKISLIENLNRT